MTPNRLPLGLCLAVALACAAGAATAQGQDTAPSFRPDATLACVEAARADGTDPALCIGTAAEACMVTNEGGGSTAGMGFCLGAEAGWWDDRLNAAYKALVVAHTALDAEMADLGSAAPRRVPALRDMQRAWIAFRDAACEYEVTGWGGGTGGGPAWAGCILDMTARQALRLEAEGMR